MSTPRLPLLALAGLLLPVAAHADAAHPRSEPYSFRNVVIGGGGFVDGIVFNRSENGLVYLRTDVGGAYRLDKAHHAWVPLLDWVGQSDWNLYGVESLASDPSDPARVYIAAGTYTNARVGNGELLASSDQGAHWQRTPLPFKLGGNEAGRNNGERLAVDPNDGRILFLGTRADGLWRSQDRGSTWARVTSFPQYEESLAQPRNLGNGPQAPQKVGINSVHFDPSSGPHGRATPVLIVTVSTPNPSVFRSTDAGATWAALKDQPIGFRPTRLALASNGVIYVSYGREAGPNLMTDGAVWRCDTATGAWTEVTPERPTPENRFGYGSVAVDPAHPDVVLAGTWSRHTPFDEIYRSTDGGRSWTALLGNSDWDHGPFAYTRTMTHHWIADIEIDPFDSGHALFPTGYGVWATGNLTDSDAGRRVLWHFEDQGIEETVPLALASPPSGAHLLSGLGDIDGMRHDDLGASPARGRFGTPLYKNTSSIAFAWRHPEVVVRVGNTYKNDQVTGAYSVDGGTTWRAFLGEPPGTVGAFWRGEGTVAISPDAKTVVWSPTGVAPHVTHDWGATWYPSVGGSVNLAVAADTVDPQRFYAYDTEAGTVVVSRDGAASFKATAGGLPVVKGRWGPARGRLAAVPGRAGEFWVIAGGILLHSTDSGTTLRASPGVAASAIAFGRAPQGSDAPAVFMAGMIGAEEGLFRSDDSGATWIRINDAAHGFGQIRVLSGDPRIFGRVYVGTGGRGIFFGDRQP